MDEYGIHKVWFHTRALVAEWRTEKTVRVGFEFWQGVLARCNQRLFANLLGYATA